MTTKFTLPHNVTEQQIVEQIIESALNNVSDIESEKNLVCKFGLQPEQATLAKNSVFKGLVSATIQSNIVNRPKREEDSLAWLSFQKAIAEPSIMIKVYGEFMPFTHIM